ncbi:protein unzipped isoform X2 [Prorops nasuta]
MSWLKSCLGLVLFSGVFVLLARADNSVHILSKYTQLVTSSTLNWLPQNHYDRSRDIVIGGFENTENEEEATNGNVARSEQKSKPLFVCRVLHMGVWVSGRQREGENLCTVSIHGNVHSYEKYDLLENVDTAARVSWVYWDKFQGQPAVGAVATDTSMFVARYNQKDSLKYTHYIGTLNTDAGLGTIVYVKDDGTEGSSEEGEVLVETEPIRYELLPVKLDWSKKRIVKQKAQIMEEATISNTGFAPAVMAEAFAFNYNYSMYWGQGHAILKGLNTSISLHNGTTLPNIVWGTEERENRTAVKTVEIWLEPGVGVNLTLRANYSVIEVPYTAKLVSHYEDGDTKARSISGIRREETMTDIIHEFGPIYYLSNFSLVPSTTMLPIVQPTTSTTTTTVTTRIPPNTRSTTIASTTIPIAEIKQSKRPETIKEADQDENKIISSKKVDSNMQRDDGGPMSLKNKSPGSSAYALRSLNPLIILGILSTIFWRIT